MSKRTPARRRKAIVLVSGGLDSATALYVARKKGFSCSCLTFDYGQRHRREIEAARQLARRARCPLTVIAIRLPWKGSSLLDAKAKIPKVTTSPGHPAEAGYASPQRSGERPLPADRRNSDSAGYHATRNIPSTYVPARNIIFLSFALSFAEAIRAQAIFIGANAIDYSGYPDCRPQFLRAYQNVIAQGTKAGAGKKRIAVCAPLIRSTKAEIIRLGRRLGVPYELTWSCYRGGVRPCGACDSCFLRAKGFREAGLCDPAA